MKNTIRELSFDQDVLHIAFQKDNSGTIHHIKFVYDPPFFQNALLGKMKEEKLDKGTFFPCSIDERYVKLVVFQNLSGDIIDFFYRKNKRVVICYYADKAQFLEGLKCYRALEQKAKTEDGNNLDRIFSENPPEIREDSAVEAYKDINSALFADSPMIVKGVSAIIDKGLEKRASDVHIEPFPQYVRIRYRIDGMLTESDRISVTLLQGLISRLKIMANLDITERRLPQDGSFQLIKNGETLDFRISFVPTINGEKAVIRILDKKILSVRLEELGLGDSQYALLKREIAKTKGIILICGPTGSGKTSTLYALLKTINNGGLNISTVEDPVEYKLEGISQVQCHNEIGRTFAATLRAFLRQDPDVLMIGEIRDPETAEIAIKAALTGHLVLSTVHTNDALGSIYRLINIGIPPYMLSASVNLAMSQRLIRKLCPHCREPDADYAGKLAWLEAGDIPEGNPIFYRGKGCPGCGFTGFVGRTGIFELLPLDMDLKEAVDRRVPFRELEKLARKNGLKYLREHGVEKAAAGITSLDEIIRQC